jgi:hypothetical protein
MYNGEEKPLKEFVLLPIVEQIHNPPIIAHFLPIIVHLTNEFITAFTVETMQLYCIPLY